MSHDQVISWLFVLKVSFERGEVKRWSIRRHEGCMIYKRHTEENVERSI